MRGSDRRVDDEGDSDRRGDDDRRGDEDGDGEEEIFSDDDEQEAFADYTKGNLLGFFL